jgi:integrase
MRVLSAEQHHTLADAVPDRDHMLIPVAGYLGMRWARQPGCRVGYVPLRERKLSVRNTVVELNGFLYDGPPKTAGSERTMTLPAFLADLICAHLGRYPSGDRYVFAALKGGPSGRTSLVATPRLQAAPAWVRCVGMTSCTPLPLSRSASALIRR